jgi:hypothetical protein
MVETVVQFRDVGTHWPAAVIEHPSNIYPFPESPDLISSRSERNSESKRDHHADVHLRGRSLPSGEESFSEPSDDVIEPLAFPDFVFAETNVHLREPPSGLRNGDLPVARAPCGNICG